MSGKLRVYNHDKSSIDIIFNDPAISFGAGYNIFTIFHNEDVFEFCSNIEEADIIPILMPIAIAPILHDNSCARVVYKKIQPLEQYVNSNQTVVLINHLFHIGENCSDIEMLNLECKCFTNAFALFNDPPKFVFLHNNASNSEEPHENLKYTEFLWNFWYSFFITQPDFIMNDDGSHDRVQWVPLKVEKKYYELNDLDRACDQNLLTLPKQNCSLDKLYLAPLKTRDTATLASYKSGYKQQIDNKLVMQNYDPGVRDNLRHYLVDLLKHWPGFIGDISGGHFLLGQGISDDELYRQIAGQGFIHTFPIHNSYYDNSVLSIYVESLTTGNRVKCVTEKTLWPLVKGHFILPFAYANFISDLKRTYGFKMPEWINYDYDNEPNDLERWAKYLGELKRVLNLGPETLYKLKIRDKHILKYNRQRFIDLGYSHPVDKNFFE